MKRDPLLKHDSSFVDKAPAVALKETARVRRAAGARTGSTTRRAGCRRATRRPSFPALFGRKPAVRYRRERWNTPDGDFIDLDFLTHDPG